MCGFSGVFSIEPLNFSFIEKSLSEIKHRGPDDQILVGISENNTPFFRTTELSSAFSKSKYPDHQHNRESKNWIGFSRLSIVDESNNGMQPFYDSQTNILFMMIGEIYNYKLLKEKYFSKNDLFVSETDTELGFKLYLILGDDFINHLKGMFSIVVFDISNGNIKSWRDATGQKPFFYAILGNKFIFSSEIKGLFPLQSGLGILDSKALAFSMYLGTCPSPLTIYKNIKSLEPGHKLDINIRNFKTQITPFWNWKYEAKKERLNTSNFENIISETIQSHLTGTPQKTLMLSGGIDSGLLAYYLQKFDNQIIAITLGDKNDKENELNSAFTNANYAGLKLETTNFEDFDLETLLTYEDQPNEAPEPAYFLSKKASQLQSKVIFSGLGLDEIFGGYEYYSSAQNYKLASKITPIISNFSFLFNKKNKINDFHKFGYLIIPFLKRSMYDWDDLKKIFETESQSWEHPFEFLIDKLMQMMPNFKHLPILKQYSLFDIYYYISCHHALRNDHASMKFSQEMRSPFIEGHFMQELFHFESIFDSISSQTKPYLRNFAKQKLAPEIFALPKKGLNSNYMSKLLYTKADIKINKKFESLKNLKTTFNLMSITKMYEKYG